MTYNHTLARAVCIAYAEDSGQLTRDNMRHFATRKEEETWHKGTRST